MSKIVTFMNLAKKESLKSSIRCSHGAVLTDGKRIISKGYNHERSQYKDFDKICSCHAERDVVMKLLALKGWRRRWWVLQA